MKRQHHGLSSSVPRGVLGNGRRLPYGALAIAAAFALSSALAWPGAAGAVPARAQSSTLAFPAAPAPALGSEAVTAPDLGGTSAIQVLGLSSLGGRTGGSAPDPLAHVAANRAAMTEKTSPGALAQPAPLAADQGIRPAMLSPGLLLEHPVATRRISSPYGWRFNPTGFGRQIHIGQDYPISCGSTVRASESGRVVVAGWAGHSGQRVTIDHGHEVQTGYSHNSLLLVRVGELVVQGQIIALAGTTGNSTGCHVHFEVIVNGQWHNPRNYLPSGGGQRQALFASTQFAVDAGSAIRHQPATGRSGQYAGAARHHGSARTEHPAPPKTTRHSHADPLQPPAASKKKQAAPAKPKAHPKKKSGKLRPTPRPAQPAPEPSKKPEPPQKLNTGSPKATPSASASPAPVSAKPSAPSVAPTPSTAPVAEPSPSTAPTASPSPSALPSSVSPSAPDSVPEATESTNSTPTSEPTQVPGPSEETGVEPREDQGTGGKDAPASEDPTDPAARVERQLGAAQPKTVDLQAQEPEKKPPVAKALPPAKSTAAKKPAAKEVPAAKPKPEVAVPAAKKQAKPPVKPKAAAPAKPKVAAPVKQVAKAPVATLPKPKPAIAAPAVQKVAPAPAKPKPQATAAVKPQAAAPAKLPQAPAAASPPASEAKP
ncbi:Murein DD-endopeptidase MepM [compost metagenome]